jgi:5-methylcytosine-specific restriction endonuclease McrA
MTGSLPHMKKHQFTQAQRFVIWTCEGYRCCWCGNPIDFLEMTVDHVVPEHLQEKPDDYKAYRELHALPESFQYQ